MKRKNLPIITISSIKENSDGSANITFDYEQDFVKLFKQENPKVRATKKQIGKWILILLENGLKNE